MAGELTKGLNLLLHPKFTEICQRLDRIEALHKDLVATVALKEEREEVDHLREHVARQLQHVDSMIGMNREKMLSLDELRNRELRGLASTVDTKATVANLAHLTEQVQALTHTLTTKAEVAKVEQLSKSYHSLSEDLAQKASASQAEQLTRDLQALREQLMRKIDFSTTDRLSERIKGLAEEISIRAETARVTELSRKLDALAEVTAQKAEQDTVDTLSRKHQVLSEDVAQRAEARKMEHLSRQFAQLTDEVSLKAEHATAEQTLRHVTVLGEAIAQKTESAAHTNLLDQVNKVREDVLALKAESTKWDDHSRQLEALHSTVSVNSTRVKHLSLLCNNLCKDRDKAGGDHPEPMVAKTPVLTPSGMQSFNEGRLGGERLPSLGGTTQKPGLVTLPSMGHAPQTARG